MGGGGGGYFSGDPDPQRLADRMRDAERQADDAHYASEIDGYLADQLARFNNRDTDAIANVLNQIAEITSNEVGETIKTLFGGSIAKHTYVDGLSDVDALMVFQGDAKNGLSPAELKQALADVLADHFGHSAVTVGQLAVTVETADQCIQLLPARRAGDLLQISAADGKGWASIKPGAFAEKLTSVNRNCGGKVVPTIKVAKAILAQVPEQRRLTGYHVESLAIQAFRDYTGPRTTRQMLAHFFDKAQDGVRSPIQDASGQSIHVDEYLGEANSVARRIRSDTLGRIARKIRNAEGAQSVSQWRQLLGEVN